MQVDRIQLEIAIKHDKARQEIADITQRLQGETKQLKELDIAKRKAMKKYRDESHPEVIKATQAYEAQSKKINGLKSRRDELRASLKVEGLSIAEVRDELKKYNMILSNLTPGTDKFNETKKHVDDLKSRLKELNQNANDTRVGLLKFADDANKIGFFITNAFAIKDRIVAWADQYVQSFAKMDEAMTDVMKYTGQTKAEVEEMNETFKQMTTRTPREELNALAGAAGRLGIQGKKDIEGFVDAADKINVALGDDLGEGAIDQIGKLTMVFGEDKTKGLNGAMLATGSAINVLGANSSANTGFITEFTSSMAGMAVNARISQTDIMGYASALSQAGIEGQTASGVFAQLITKMFTDPAKFARAAKLDVKAFTDLLKTDANAAILQFLEGLRQNGGFDSLAPALKSLKMQGTQAVPVISSLINKMDELKKAQSDARQAYDEGTSIIEEFNNANSSAAAKLEMAQKAMNDEAAALGQKLMPIVEGSITAGKTALRIISSLISFTIQHRNTIATVSIAIGTYSAALAAAWLWEKRFAAEKAINLAMDKLVTVATKAKTIAVLAYTVVLNRLQGHTFAAARAQVALNAAMNANVFAAVATAIAAVVTIGYQLYKRLTDITEAQHALKDAAKEVRTRMIDEQTEMEQLVSTVKSATASEDDRKRALEEINGRLMDKHLGNLTEEQIRTGKAKIVLDQYNQSLMDQIENEVLLGKLKEARTKQMNAENGEFDTSFIDDAKAVMRSIVGFVAGSPSGNAFTGMKIGWKTAMEDTRQQVLKDTQETIDAIQEKIEENKERVDFSSYMGRMLDTQRIKLEGETEDPHTEGSSGSGNSGFSSESDKERNARLKKQRDERKEQVAEAKAAYEREKIELRQQYQGREKLKDEWHEKEFKAEERYITKLLEIRRNHGAAESDLMEAANMELDLIAREAHYKEEQRKRKQAEALEAIDREQAAEEVGLARERLSGEISTEEEYSRRKLEVEIKYQQQRIAELKEGSAEYLAAQKQLLQLEMQQLQQNKKDDDSFKSDFQDTNNRMLHYNFEGESFDRMRELNEEYREKDLISYQQYQQNLSDIAQQEADRRQQIEQAAVDGVSNLLSSASQLFSAMQQRETAAVDAKYKKMIAAAKKQGKDTTKLEEQQEAEKQAIAKKYADRQFQIQVLQIVGNTAQGISKTIAEMGMPWAVPFVAMAAAAGAMQLASAKAAADQAAGLYDGGFSDDYQEGYTRKGNPKEQAGVIPVHKNEFVANHKAVANPDVRPVLDVIDRHQKMGDIQMLDSTRMLEEAYGRGRYRGGYVQQEAGSSIPHGESPQAPQPDNAEVMELLRTIARNTGLSLTVRGLRKEIRHEEQLERNANR